MRLLELCLMYYRVLTVECVWLSLCAYQWKFLWNVQRLWGFVRLYFVLVLVLGPPVLVLVFGLDGIVLAKRLSVNLSSNKRTCVTCVCVCPHTPLPPRCDVSITVYTDSLRGQAYGCCSPRQAVQTMTAQPCRLNKLLLRSRPGRSDRSDNAGKL